MATFSAQQHKIGAANRNELKFPATNNSNKIVLSASNSSNRGLH